MSYFWQLAVALSCTLCSGVVQAQSVAAEAGTAPSPTVTINLDEASRAVVSGANAFSLDLFRKSRKPGENLFVSPSSVSSAVGFAYRGAVGKTAEELALVLRFPFAPAENLRAYGPVLDTIQLSAAGRELRTANAIWAQSGMPLNADFERDMATFAKAGLQRVDFKADPEAARLAVNRWVDGSTRHKIPDLIGSNIIKKSTKAVLVNAVYFKADWRTAFEKAGTKPEPFNAVDGSKTVVPLMHLRTGFQAVQRGNVRAVLLPYLGNEVSLAVFLPDRAGALPSWEDKLTSEQIASWLADLDRSEPQDVILTLPKLHLRWNKDLASDIREMGAPTPFSDLADFSGMAKLPSPGGDPTVVGLKITNVIHEATIDLDEVGSEAAAATAVVMGDIIVTGSGGGGSAPEPFIFRADKPFMFLIRDNRTGLILFMGHYQRPGEAAVKASAAP